MESFRGDFIGERLREAREFNELSQTKLAQLIGVQRQTISAIEKDVQNPNAENTIKISNALKFPIEYFYYDNNYNNKITGVTTFRSVKSSSKRKKLRAEIFIKWLYQIIINLKEYVEFPEFNLEGYENIDYKKLKPHDIEIITDEIRNRLNIGFGPIINIVNLIENQGVFVGVSEFPEKIDAFSASYKNFATMLSSFENNKAARNRFNLAHELGHIVLHRLIDEEQYIEDFNLIEKQAHRFASSLLLPRNEFTKEFFSTDLNNLIRMKERWHVSIAAIVVRARQLNLISEDKMSNVFRRMNYNGIRKIEPLDDRLIIDRPTLLKKAIELIIDNDVSTKEKFIKEVGVPGTFIAQIVDLEDDYFIEHNKIIDFNLKLKNST